MHLSKQNKFFFYLIGLISFIAVIVLLRPYLTVITLSFVTALVLHPVYEKVMRWSKGRKKVSLLLSLVTGILAIILPLLLVINETVKQTARFSRNISNYINSNDVTVEFVVSRINEWARLIPGANYSITEQELASQVSELARNSADFILDNLVNIGSRSFAIIPMLIIFFTLLVAFLPSIDNIRSYIKRLSPLSDKIDELYMEKVIEMTKSMVRGTFLIAIVQGVVSGIFMWIAGVDYIFFLVMLMILFSILPLGSGIVAIPVGISLLLTGQIWQGILVLASNLLLVSNIDNVMRPKLVSDKASLHPALVILSVVSGISAFGFLGFIYGPVIMIFFVTTLEVYENHYRKV